MQMILIENVSGYSIFPEPYLGLKIQHYILSILRRLFSCFNNFEIRMSLIVSDMS